MFFCSAASEASDLGTHHLFPADGDGACAPPDAGPSATPDVGPAATPDLGPAATLDLGAAA